MEKMHIGSVPWNNEPIISHLEDKWCWIVALNIGYRFDSVVDSRLLGKEVKPSITLRVEV